MTKYLVSLDGAVPVELDVEAPYRIGPGILCEVDVNGARRLCIVQYVGPLVINMHPLPTNRSSADSSSSPPS